MFPADDVVDPMMSALNGGQNTGKAFPLFLFLLNFPTFTSRNPPLGKKTAVIGNSKKGNIIIVTSFFRRRAVRSYNEKKKERTLKKVSLLKYASAGPRPRSAKLNSLLTASIPEKRS